MLQRIIEVFTEDSFVTIQGFDEAVIGVSEVGNERKIVYSYKIMVEILIKIHGVTERQAEEILDFDVLSMVNSQDGNSPIICIDRL
jgi:hypothetical protein